MATYASSSPPIGTGAGGLADSESWIYRSSNQSTDILGLAGWFTGQGAGSAQSSYGCAGMRVGDPVLLINSPSTSSVISGEAVWGSVTALVTSTGWPRIVSATVDGWTVTT